MPEPEPSLFDRVLTTDELRELRAKQTMVQKAIIFQADYWTVIAEAARRQQANVTAFLANLVAQDPQVQQVAREMQIPLLPHRLNKVNNKVDRERVIALRLEGKTRLQISQLCNVSLKSVDNVLRQARADGRMKPKRKFK